MKSHKQLKDVLVDELKDLFSAETQLLEVMPKLISSASAANLKKALTKHLGETEAHVERLKVIGAELGESLTGKTCKAMKGLIAEGEEALKEKDLPAELHDVLLIGAARRVEHYEMAGYEVALGIAQALDLESVANSLEQTLEEEMSADEALSDIADDEILDESQVGRSRMFSEDEVGEDHTKLGKTSEPAVFLQGKSSRKTNGAQR